MRDKPASANATPRPNRKQSPTLNLTATLFLYAPLLRVLRFKYDYISRINKPEC